jgi:hypothetical protein
VVFAHGYEGEGSGQGSMHTSPLATYLTRQVYAWAASGYRSRGIRPDWFVADTLAVRELFIRDIGPPHWTIMHGMSMGGDLPLRLQGLEQRYLAKLVFSPEDVANHPLYRAASTLHIRYRIDPGLGVTEEELNAQIYRKSPAPGARSPATDPVFAELTGHITVPVLALHETGDARVPFSLQQMYRRRTLTAGTAHLLVQRAVRWPGHCTFTGEVREQAFDDLVRWIEGGSQPDGDNVLASDVSQIGLRWTPLLHVEDPLRH